MSFDIQTKIKIERSADKVWQVVGEEFDQAYKWMSFVVHSYKTEGPASIDGAPVSGRICEFTDKPNGLGAEETILAYEPANRRIVFDVVPINQPILFPVKKNRVTLTVKALGNDASEVTWASSIETSLLGTLISPLLKRGLSKSFANVLSDLKRYADEGKF